MPIQQDIIFNKFQDGTLILSLVPAAPIGGLEIEFLVEKRFDGGSGLIRRSMASGFYGVSGMNIIDSGTGVMSIDLSAEATSGLDYGNYAFRHRVLTSGQRLTATEGYFILTP